MSEHDQVVGGCSIWSALRQQGPYRGYDVYGKRGSCEYVKEIEAERGQLHRMRTDRHRRRPENDDVV